MSVNIDIFTTIVFVPFATNV